MKRAVHLVALAAVAIAVLIPAGAQAAPPSTAVALDVPNTVQAASVLNGTIVLQNRATGLCIDDSGVGLRGFGCQPPNGAYISYQKFTMQPNGAYDILKSAGTGLCLDDSSSYGLRGFACQPSNGANVKYQEFTVTQVGSYIVLKSLATGLCIDDSNVGLRGFGCQPLNGADIAYQEFSSPVRNAIVAAAQSEVGYQDSPAGTYCNPFSAYWGVGDSCGGGLRSEEWCADFAAWAWDMAGAPFTYGYGATDINAGAISFYYWGHAQGTWHAAGSGYTPQPGDAAVYGLNLSASPAYADHVAVVTGGSSSAPNVINGDWWDSGNGAVVAATGQGSNLSGYVSPNM
jgi:hypothetical protein